MMNLNDTIRAFRCCVQIPPDCANCPEQGPGFGIECRKDVKASVFHWLKAQEPSDDWISRKRLKNEIQYYIEEAGWGEEINKALGWCLEFIDNQEAVKWE